jgi:hypothetical protein
VVEEHAAGSAIYDCSPSFCIFPSTQRRYLPNAIRKMTALWPSVLAGTSRLIKPDTNADLTVFDELA